MCNDEYLFMDYESLKAPLKVKLGDGYEVDAIGSGSVMLKCPLPSGISNKCKLHKVLLLLVIKLESSIISTVVQTVLALTLQKPKIVKS